MRAVTPVVQSGAHRAVIPAKAGIHGRPRHASVCLSWMATFVAMTLGGDGRLSIIPAVFWTGCGPSPQGEAGFLRPQVSCGEGGGV
jgi:hypothetical protein